MYKMKNQIRYSEVTADETLDLVAMINYFQDCSTFHSQSIGKGPTYLKDNHRAWLLSSWHIIIYRFPNLFESVITGTLPYEFNRCFGYRNFFMYDETDKLCAVANSTWVLVDTNTNKPLRLTQEDTDGYILSPKMEMEEAPRKISLPDSFKSLTPFTVTHSNIDTNHHVNNGQYVKIASEFLPPKFFVHQMRAEYKKPAVLNDVIYPKIGLKDGKYVIILADFSNNAYAIVEFT